MSAPDAKAWVPAPRYTIARTTSSLARSVVTRARSSHMLRLIALRTPGRLKTTVAMAPSRCTRTSGWLTETQCSKEWCGAAQPGQKENHYSVAAHGKQLLADVMLTTSV